MVAPLAVANADSNAGKVLLCTSNGYQWVSIETFDYNGSSDFANPSDKSTGSETHLNHCVFCLNADDDFDALVSSFQLSISDDISEIRQGYGLTEHIQPAPIPRALSPPLS
jgi:hypothetical protein